ncbi:MAG: pyridoxal phosphate-dependent aminotransferase [Tissierellia bacterium]|nr:pyridoxal phosphate-dependent aminotransferase [Tissierellia bacterium]
MTIFDERIDRSNTSSVKYEEMDVKFGRNDLIPYWVADMDFRLPEFAIKTMQKRLEHGIFGYTKREEDYYDSIVNWLYTQHGLKVDKECVEYGPGVVFLLNMMIRKFTAEGDKIIIQPPVYYPFFKVIEGNGRVILENTLILEDGKYKINFIDLESKAKDPKCKMMIFCSPHNPVGRVWNKNELEKVAKICYENNVLLISDEIHFDLVFPPNKHIPIVGVNEKYKENIITCTSPSKTFNIAGLHSAYWIIFDKEKMDIYKNELGLLDLNRSNVFSREVTPELYKNGAKWVGDLVRYLLDNRNYAVSFINKIPGLKTNFVEGTYLLWIDCRDLGLNTNELNDLFVNKAKVALDSGDWFGETGKGFMRLNFACSKSMLEEGLNRIKSAVIQMN